MDEGLKILILEDVEYDAELTEREMRREGINFSSLRVETENDFITGLEDFKPDVILADHSLPNFDGITALEITEERYPQVPFIFVSGKIGDEFAVEMLKKGAKDYVFKNNLKKLVPAVKRALTERNELLELKNSKKELQEALKEKEMLIKEIHHRVKNNLMIISGLLELQSNYINDKKDFDFFIESKKRADSMALIHERLYQSTELKKIDFKDYIDSLATDLFNTYAINPDKIELIVNAENILLDINMAIPLGLIINELLTNSLKYAFPVGYGSRLANEAINNGNFISVDFSKNDGELTLVVKDNGIGFPQDLDYKNTDSMGLELVNNLTKQIDGVIEFNNSNGTEFKILFQELSNMGSL